MSLDIHSPMQYQYRRGRSQIPPQHLIAYTDSSYTHTEEFPHPVPSGSRLPYSHHRRTAYPQVVSDLPYSCVDPPPVQPQSSSRVYPQTEPYYIQQYLQQKGENIQEVQLLREWGDVHTRRRRPRPRVSRSQPSTVSPSPEAVPLHALDSSSFLRSAQLRSPQPRSAYLFPFDESELVAVRSMWLDQGRRGLNLVEGLVRPPSVQTSVVPTVSKVDDKQDKSMSSSSSTAPSALFDTASVSSDATATSVETIRSPASKLLNGKGEGKVKVAPKSPSRARTTTALSVDTGLERSLSRYVTVSPDQSPLHAPAQTVLESVLDKERPRLSKEEVSHPRAPSLPRRKTEPTQSPSPPLTRRRRARSASESSLPSLAVLTTLAWLNPVESFVGLVGSLPTTYIPLPSEHSQAQPPSPRPRSRRRRLLSPSATPTSPARPLLETSPTPKLEAVEHPPISLLPLPLHPQPPPHTPIIPPIRSLPRSPYRPSNPPLTPTPRMRIVPNPQFLRLKALQNRVLWGLVPVDRGEYEVLRRVGIGMRRNQYGKHAAAQGGWPEEVDREGRMCSGKEARVGVAIEGRRRGVLVEGESVVVVKDDDDDNDNDIQKQGPKRWLQMSLKWAGMAGV